MIGALTLLLCYQLAGEVLARSLGLPVPGPVVGMLLLFVTLLLRGSLPHSLETTAQHLLKYLSLLFVPAGVGVMVHIGLLRSEWLPIAIVLVVSTVLTIGVTALTLRAFIVLLRPSTRQKEENAR